MFKPKAQEYGTDSSRKMSRDGGAPGQKKGSMPAITGLPYIAIKANPQGSSGVIGLINEPSSQGIINSLN